MLARLFGTSNKKPTQEQQKYSLENLQAKCQQLSAFATNSPQPPTNTPLQQQQQQTPPQHPTIPQSPIITTNVPTPLTSFTQAQQYVAINEHNSEQLINALVIITELMIWGDKHDQRFFEFFADKQLLKTLMAILNQSSKLPTIQRQIIQSISMLLQNTNSQMSIFYYLSNNIINELIVYNNYDLSNEDVLSTYISFVKTLSNTINPQTLHFLFNVQNNDFPLLAIPLKWYATQDGLIRNFIRTIILNVYNNSGNDIDLYHYLSLYITPTYMTNVMWNLTYIINTMNKWLNNVYYKYNILLTNNITAILFTPLLQDELSQRGFKNCSKNGEIDTAYVQSNINEITSYYKKEELNSARLDELLEQIIDNLLYLIDLTKSNGSLHKLPLPQSILDQYNLSSNTVLVSKLLSINNTIVQRDERGVEDSSKDKIPHDRRKKYIENEIYISDIILEIMFIKLIIPLLSSFHNLTQHMQRATVTQAGCVKKTQDHMFLSQPEQNNIASSLQYPLGIYSSYTQLYSSMTKMRGNVSQTAETMFNNHEPHANPNNISRGTKHDDDDDFIDYTVINIHYSFTLYLITQVFTTLSTSINYTSPQRVDYQLKSILDSMVLLLFSTNPSSSPKSSDSVYFHQLINDHYNNNQYPVIPFYLTAPQTGLPGNDDYADIVSYSTADFITGQHSVNVPLNNDSSVVQAYISAQTHLTSPSVASSAGLYGELPQNEDSLAEDEHVFGILSSLSSEKIPLVDQNVLNTRAKMTKPHHYTSPLLNYVNNVLNRDDGVSKKVVIHKNNYNSYRELILSEGLLAQSQSNMHALMVFIYTIQHIYCSMSLNPTNLANIDKNGVKFYYNSSILKQQLGLSYYQDPITLFSPDCTANAGIVDIISFDKSTQKHSLYDTQYENIHIYNDINTLYDDLSLVAASTEDGEQSDLSGTKLVAISRSRQISTSSTNSSPAATPASSSVVGSPGQKVIISASAANNTTSNPSAAPRPVIIYHHNALPTPDSYYDYIALFNKHFHNPGSSQLVNSALLTAKLSYTHHTAHILPSIISTIMKYSQNTVQEYRRSNEPPLKVNNTPFFSTILLLLQICKNTYIPHDIMSRSFFQYSTPRIASAMSHAVMSVTKKQHFATSYYTTRVNNDKELLDDIYRTVLLMLTNIMHIVGVKISKKAQNDEGDDINQFSLDTNGKPVSSPYKITFVSPASTLLWYKVIQLINTTITQLTYWLLPIQQLNSPLMLQQQNNIISSNTRQQPLQQQPSSPEPSEKIHSVSCFAQNEIIRSTSSLSTSDTSSVFLQQPTFYIPPQVYPSVLYNASPISLFGNLINNTTYLLYPTIHKNHHSNEIKDKLKQYDPAGIYSLPASEYTALYNKLHKNTTASSLHTRPANIDLYNDNLVTQGYSQQTPQQLATASVHKATTLYSSPYTEKLYTLINTFCGFYMLHLILHSPHILIATRYNKLDLKVHIYDHFYDILGNTLRSTPTPPTNTSIPKSCNKKLVAPILPLLPSLTLPTPVQVGNIIRVLNRSSGHARESSSSLDQSFMPNDSYTPHLSTNLIHGAVRTVSISAGTQDLPPVYEVTICSGSSQSLSSSSLHHPVRLNVAKNTSIPTLSSTHPHNYSLTSYSFTSQNVIHTSAINNNLGNNNNNNNHNNSNSNSNTALDNHAPNQVQQHPNTDSAILQHVPHNISTHINEHTEELHPSIVLPQFQSLQPYLGDHTFIPPPQGLPSTALSATSLSSSQQQHHKDILTVTKCGKFLIVARPSQNNRQVMKVGPNSSLQQPSSTPCQLLFITPTTQCFALPYDFFQPTKYMYARLSEFYPGERDLHIQSWNSGTLKAMNMGKSEKNMKDSGSSSPKSGLLTPKQPPPSPTHSTLSTLYNSQFASNNSHSQGLEKTTNFNNLSNLPLILKDDYPLLPTDICLIVVSPYKPHPIAIPLDYGMMRKESSTVMDQELHTPNGSNFTNNNQSGQSTAIRHLSSHQITLPSSSSQPALNRQTSNPTTTLTVNTPTTNTPQQNVNNVITTNTTTKMLFSGILPDLLTQDYFTATSKATFINNNTLSKTSENCTGLEHLNYDYIGSPASFTQAYTHKCTGSVTLPQPSTLPPQLLQQTSVMVNHDQKPAFDNATIHKHILGNEKGCENEHSLDSFNICDYTLPQHQANIDNAINENLCDTDSSSQPLDEHELLRACNTFDDHHKYHLLAQDLISATTFNAMGHNFLHSPPSPYSTSPLVNIPGGQPQHTLHTSGVALSPQQQPMQLWALPLRCPSGLVAGKVITMINDAHRHAMKDWGVALSSMLVQSQLINTNQRKPELNEEQVNQHVLEQKKVSENKACEVEVEQAEKPQNNEIEELESPIADKQQDQFDNGECDEQDQVTDDNTQAKKKKVKKVVKKVVKKSAKKFE